MSMPTTSWQDQPKLPDSYAYRESSLARRLQRRLLEFAYTLACSTNPQSREKYNEVFGFCTMFESGEDIVKRLKACMDGPEINHWRAPFIHLGGAGLHYPAENMRSNGSPFRTVRSIGPMTNKASEANNYVDNMMLLTLPGIAGEYFDTYDIESYFMARGLDITRGLGADYVTCELDLTGIEDEMNETVPSTMPSLRGASSQVPENPALPTMPISPNNVPGLYQNPLSRHPLNAMGLATDQAAAYDASSVPPPLAQETLNAKNLAPASEPGLRHVVKVKLNVELLMNSKSMAWFYLLPALMVCRSHLQGHLSGAHAWSTSSRCRPCLDGRCESWNACLASA